MTMILIINNMIKSKHTQESGMKSGRKKRLRERVESKTRCYDRQINKYFFLFSHNFVHLKVALTDLPSIRCI
jgi:hypothetical protein